MLLAGLLAFINNSSKKTKKNENLKIVKNQSATPQTEGNFNNTNDSQEIYGTLDDLEKAEKKLMGKSNHELNLEFLREYKLLDSFPSILSYSEKQIVEFVNYLSKEGFTATYKVQNWSMAGTAGFLPSQSYEVYIKHEDYENAQKFLKNNDKIKD